MLLFQKNSSDLTWSKKKKYHLKSMCTHFDANKNKHNTTLSLQIGQLDNRIRNDIKNYKMEFWDSQKEKLDDLLAPGFNNLVKFCRVITNITTYTMFDYQLMLLHREFLVGIPAYFYDLWDQHKQSILRYFDLDMEFAILLSLAERRGGKTAYVEMLFIALILTMTEKKDKQYLQGMYSVNLKRSQAVIEEIIDMLGKVPEAFKAHVDIHARSTDLQVTNKLSNKRSDLVAKQTGQVSATQTHSALHC